MVKIYRELLAADDLSAVSIQMLLLELIHHSRNLQNEQEIPSWIKRVHELLLDKWDEKINLKELSLIANVQPVTVSKYFPQYFSCTLGEYLRKLKVEKAINLLKSSPVSLTDVAIAAGSQTRAILYGLLKPIPVTHSWPGQR